MKWIFKEKDENQEKVMILKDFIDKEIRIKFTASVTNSETPIDTIDGILKEVSVPPSRFNIINNQENDFIMIAPTDNPNQLFLIRTNTILEIEIEYV